MPHILAVLLALLQMTSPALMRTTLSHQLRSGDWLRFHVIAQDDTPVMQAVKLQVRDAVQAAWTDAGPQSASMLTAAQALLPALTAAAEDAAREAGFSGDVTVTLGTAAFDDRELFGVPVPAGEYPALVIRLGDARGRNWWGLLDPETSLAFAAIAGEEDVPVLWDWSWKALLAALFGL